MPQLNPSRRTAKPSGGYAWNTKLKSNLRGIEEHQPEEVQPNRYRPSSVLDSVGNLTTIQQLYSKESLHSSFCLPLHQPHMPTLPPPPAQENEPPICTKNQPRTIREPKKQAKARKPRHLSSKPSQIKDRKRKLNQMFQPSSPTNENVYLRKHWTHLNKLKFI